MICISYFLSYISPFFIDVDTLPQNFQTPLNWTWDEILLIKDTMILYGMNSFEKSKELQDKFDKTQLYFVCVAV